LNERLRRVRRSPPIYKRVSRACPTVGRVSDIPLHLMNLEAERSVLAVVLGASERLDVARDRIAAPGVFFDPKHQCIYSHMLKIADGGGRFDLVTLKASISAAGHMSVCGGADYLSHLGDGLPRSSQLEEYTRTVHGLWRERQTYLTLVALTSRFAVPGGFEDLDPLDAAMGELGGLDVAAGGLSFMDGEAMGRRALELLASSSVGERRGLSTGFPTLDGALGGGLQTGDLYIVGGRPASGKSALVGNIALNVARTRTVCMFSQEMDADENIERFVAILAGINMNNVRQGSIHQSDYARLTNACDDLMASRLRLNDSTGITAQAVRSAARREQARGDLGLVIVDYLQMMGTGPLARNRDRRDQELGDTTLAMKNMAKELRVPVILVASLNRGPETRTGDKRPLLSDLRDSGQIESDADVVLFTYRDELYNKGPDVEKGVTELLIRKGRNSGDGVVKLRFDPEYTRFREMESWAA
jgi:replicative DNA helicase